jgi:hypothetical protein
VKVGVSQASEGWDLWAIEVNGEHIGERPSDRALGFDACIEGNASEMIAIAEAIELRCRASFKRCAIEPIRDGFELWSPRNSQRRAKITPAEAVELAADIRAKCSPKESA